MGAACSAVQKVTNQHVNATNNNSRPTASECTVHMLITALDYKATSNPLTCTLDGKNMEQLARMCGQINLKTMYDNECTSDNVIRAMQEIGSQMDKDDFFIFYYSGHGTSITDEDGDEKDGEDEAFCFVTPDGQINFESCMTDDKFAEVVTDAMPEGCRILIMTDCCHSGTIADLGKDCWSGYDVLSIAGCSDAQTSGDIGTGGIFTHSMLLAIESIQGDGDEDYSAGKCYNTTLEFDDKIFNSEQDITIQSNSNTSPETFAWPLIPNMQYTSPMTLAQSGGRGLSPDAPGGGGGVDPAQLQQLGINPQLAQLAAHALQDQNIDDIKAQAMSAVADGGAGCKQQ